LGLPVVFYVQALYMRVFICTVQTNSIFVARRTSEEPLNYQRNSKQATKEPYFEYIRAPVI